MSQFHLTTIVMVLLSATSSSVSSGSEAPNIVLILTDDQGWPTLGCYGGKLADTPHLDRLADEGVRFTDAYVMPQCTPTRAALLTGQHTARNGMWHVIGWYGSPWARMTEPAFVESLPRDSFTIAKGLQQAGYATACLGKWHLTTNEDGHYVGLKPSAAKHYGFDFAPAHANPRYHQEGDKGVDWLTDQAIEFAKKHRKRPFFIYLSHHTIHGPVIAPEALVQKYRRQGRPETGMHNATYLAALEHMDRSVGRLLQALDELELAGNTMVVFLSDNGGVNQLYDHRVWNPAEDEIQLKVKTEEYDNAPLRAGKGSVYEGGIRVPCIVRWPGKIERGRTCDAPIHVVDWLPTLLAAARVQAPKQHAVDGLDLAPLFSGAEKQPHAFSDRALHFHMPLYDLRWGATPCAAIRRGEFKLIEFYGDRFDATGRYVPGHQLELYDLQNDIGERKNLALARPELAERLLKQLRNWQSNLNAEIPTKNPHFDPQRRFVETRDKPEFPKP